MEKRESWASRMTFIFAAIGSAVGLGNAWRFPGLAAKHGGGAFLLVYIVGMFVLGWPLLMMEIAMGRKMQRGAPIALRGMNKKAEFIGWAAVGNAFIIVTYYAVVLAWILFMIVKAFSLGGMTPSAAGNVFPEQVLKNLNIGQAGSLDIPSGMMLALLISWAAIYLCIRKGAHSAGKVVPYTVMVPIVLLLVLAVNGMVKDFSIAGGKGLATFFIPKWGALADAGLWIDAFGQVFYSLSIMMAIMIAYGSFVSKKSDIVKDSLIIAVSDMFISFLAGIVLFTTFSGTGMLEGYLENPAGGVGTAFFVYPQAMVMLTKNGAVNSMFAVIFYLTLLTLAIDSAFSIVEGVSTAISDKFRLKKRSTTLAICLAAFVVSLLFAGRSGLSWLDIADKWANNFSLILVGILECIVVGWFFRTEKLREELNRTATKIKLHAWYDWLIKIVIPLILSVLFVWNIVTLSISYAKGEGGYGGYPIYAQVLGGWLPAIVVFVGGIVMQIVSHHNKKIIELDSSLKSWDESHDEELRELEEEGLVVPDETLSGTDCGAASPQCMTKTEE